MSLVSVIIPTYNRAHLIRQTIDSVLKQDYSDLELIVIDDGSTDYTKDVLLYYGDRIKYFFQNNLGIAAARNHGIRVSRGEYLIFIDSDDLMGANIISQAVSALEENKDYDVAYGTINHFRKDQLDPNSWPVKSFPDFSGNIFGALVQGHHLTPGQFLIRKKCVTEIGSFVEELKEGEDWEFILRMADKYKFYFCPKIFLSRRVHEGMVTLSKKKIDIVELRKGIVQRLFPDRYKEIESQYLTGPVVANWYRSFGFDYLEGGNKKEGKVYLWKSLQTWPWQPRLYGWFFLNFIKSILDSLKEGQKT